MKASSPPIEHFVVFNVLKEITTALLSCLLVDILFSYDPIKIKENRIKDTSMGFRFSNIMLHSTLAAISIPYFIYVGIMGVSNIKDIVNLADNKFATQLQTIENHLNNQTDNEIFTLKQQGTLQTSILNQKLQSITSDANTEIVITDHNNIPLGANITISKEQPFIWSSGGSTISESENIFYWIPDGNFNSTLEKWNYAYIIREKNFPSLNLNAVIMTPFSPFLINLLQSIVSLLWMYLFFCSATLFLTLLYNRIFFKPLSNLAKTTTGIPLRLSKGIQIEWYKSNIFEIEALSDNFKAVTCNLENTFKRTHHLAYYDLLTGLPNRLSMQEALTEIFSNGLSNKPFALFFFDLDRFKQVNDSLGHAVGDSLLKEIATRLKTIESENIRIFRVSGDEFVAIAEETNQETAENIAQHILELIRQPVYIEQHELHITSSIGIALSPQHSDNPQTLMKLADTSMYIAKEDGRNTYSLYNKSLQSRLAEQLWLENNLRKALDSNQLSLHYQPIVDGVTSEIKGVEALIRWKHPEKGFISPAKFIPIAEQSDLIIPVGQWVLREACLQNKKWQDEGFKKVRIAVNLSARQFYNERIIEEIQLILEETKLESQYLELEITEGFMIKNPEYVNSVLNKLKSMGVSISIDDFGTGYSSLSQLKNFPVDVVKIDKSFVKNIGIDKHNSSIVKSIIELAHGMNLKVVAEGIETEFEKNFLIQHFCDEMQGYYFAHPMDAESFIQVSKKLLKNSKIIERLEY
ncbi:EAL domain-containing protein [Herbivorax sp. ANBcel31]|uniref:putative bifunctional diguanylate cyclase/phosphodiesterase n=1 Tax=Herbivorax sp. ANBcel31 TaxID=3069754 RepID=UPI0027B404FA|nr:EAL domain-containing protein [Herbivorax sp. ANBcel31]MDQ2087458.1 EAL domain-containing protein [Herbivorax sp. ANBcel31]